MRVLLLNYEFPPAGGGAGFATFHIARELVRMGLAADVLTARIEGEADGEEIDGVRVFRVPSWRKGIHDCGLRGAYSYLAFAAPKRMRLHRCGSYDVEHFFFGLPTGLLSLLPVRSGPPYVVSLRGSDVPGYDPFNRVTERLHRVLRPVTRAIWRGASSVVALSEGLREIAGRALPDPVPIDVIPNGIDTDKFHPECSREPREDDRPLRLVTVARLLERKGIHHLLEAIAGPPPLPVRLAIVGTGPYGTELRRRCAELHLEDRVAFAGFVRHDDLPELYRGADVFCLPSLTESFGLVFAEAMACGLPVVATRVGGIPELVRDGRDGLLVPPEHPDCLRAALREIVTQAGRRRAMGESAAQRIRDAFTWRIVAARYVSHYERAVRGSSRVARPANAFGRE